MKSSDLKFHEHAKIKLSKIKTLVQKYSIQTVQMVLKSFGLIIHKLYKKFHQKML